VTGKLPASPDLHFPAESGILTIIDVEIAESESVMSPDLICSWLKLPGKSWPPDHYTLLGLKPGEADAARIERHVQMRMEWVRAYQLAHPEQVTEAMTRLAKAFDCLSNQEAKKAYDEELLGKSAPKRNTQTVPPSPASPATGPPSKPTLSPPETKSPAAGLPTKPIETIPPRQEKITMSMPLPAKGEPSVADGATPPAPAPSAPASPPMTVEAISDQESIDQAQRAARSAAARRGLGTKRALYHRISRTRQLIRAWVHAGKYLGDRSYRLKDKTDAIDLVRQLTIIRQHLQDFPPVLGQAGQPGYLVIALARQPEIVKTYQSLDSNVRKSYVRDWEAGLDFLGAYRQFLREEMSKLRRQGSIGRLFRATGSVIADHPGIWLILGAMVAANIAFPILREYWHFEISGGALLLALFLIYQNSVRRQSLHRSRRRPGK
jgi:hypothetical protein